MRSAGRPVPWRTRILLALAPAVFGGIVLWRGVLDPVNNGGSDSVAVWILLALALAGVLYCVALGDRRLVWLERLATALGSGGLFAFVGMIVVGGLFAPGWLANAAASGRAPDTPVEATVMAVLMVAGLLGLVVTWLLEGRRAARRRR